METAPGSWSAWRTARSGRFLPRRSQTRYGRCTCRRARTRHLVRPSYWCSGMSNTIDSIRRNCRTCDRLKAGFFKASSQVHLLPIEGMFYRWEVDQLGPLSRGKLCVMMILDHYGEFAILRGAKCQGCKSTNQEVTSPC